MTSAVPSPHVLTSPADVVYAVPHLLGFIPHDSAIIVWISRGRVALTQRLDLPDLDSSGAPDVDWLDSVAQTATHNPRLDSAIAIVWTDGPSEEHPTCAPASVTASHLRSELEACGVRVLDLLHTDGRTWSQYPPGTDAGVITPDAPWPGESVDGDPLPSRQAAIDAVQPDPDRQQRMAHLLKSPHASHLSPPDSPAARETWRDDRIAQALSTLSTGSPDASDGTPASLDEGQIADLLAGLGDVRVRDVLLWHLNQCEPAPAARTLTHAAQAAPDGYRAPVMTVAGLMWWCAGDGVRGMACIAQALADQDGYSLALLVAGALTSGMPPAVWRTSLTGLTEQECRHPGTGDRGARPA